MSDLHARVLAELDRLDPHRLTTLGKAVSAVVELHAPDPDLPSTCGQCMQVVYGQGEAADYPCSTIQAIARELGVDGAVLRDRLGTEGA